MTQARLLIDLPDGLWITDVSKRYPETSFKVLSGVPGDEEGYALIWIRSEQLESVVEEAMDHDTMVELSLLETSESTATIQIETSAPLLLLAAKRSGVPIEMPVSITDGVATVDVAGAHDRLSELGNQFRRLGISFDVEYVQRRSSPEQMLTPKQRELVEAAVELGYYDTPRECTLTELAESVDLAKSTCSETLHRAEETIVKQFLEDYDDQGPNEVEVPA